MRSKSLANDTRSLFFFFFFFFFFCFFFFENYFSEKIKQDISCESCTKQTIHMEWQALFSLKKKNPQSRLLQLCLAFLRVLIPK